MVKVLFFFLIVCTGYAQPIRVMTYNIRYDNAGDSVNRWSNRKQKVFDLIKKHDPDIIGVQEALHHQLTDITENLASYVFIGVGRDDGKEKGEFSAILYKKDHFEVRSQKTTWLSETPDVPGSKSWDAAITRVATWVNFMDKKSKQEFLVINTHFDHIGKEARKQSAAQLLSRLSDYSLIGFHEYGYLPVVITGDFNCTRDEDPYKAIMSSSERIFSDPAPKNPPGTFCGFMVNSIPCRPIDYIFYTKKQRNKRQWRHRDYKVIQDNDGKYYPSDHLPVMVTLEIK